MISNLHLLSEDGKLYETIRYNPQVVELHNKVIEQEN